VSLDKKITNCTKQNPSLQTHSTSVSQAIPHISYNPLIHCGFHILTQVCIQRKIIPVDLKPFLVYPFNIILPSIPKSSKLFVPSIFPTTNSTVQCTVPCKLKINFYTIPTQFMLNVITVWLDVGLRSVTLNCAVRYTACCSTFNRQP
jgi:hypothetical protein